MGYSTEKVINTLDFLWRQQRHFYIQNGEMSKARRLEECLLMLEETAEDLCDLMEGDESVLPCLDETQDLSEYLYE